MNSKSQQCHKKNCPFCQSRKIVKKGKQLSKQRYQCRNCKKQFQSKSRKGKLIKKIWKDYSKGKQSFNELSKKYHKSRQWISNQFESIKISQNNLEKNLSKYLNIVADAMFFNKTHGILVFREPNKRINLIWKEINKEKPEYYLELKTILESQNFIIKSITIDGRRGVKEIFSDIPVQMCHFHQTAIITRYLTKKPKLSANKELREIALTLKNSTEKIFSKKLNAWYLKWNKFLNEKTLNPTTQRKFFTHKRLRSAYRSLITNLPFLFTYRKYSNIPNTTNSMEGTFSELKKIIRLHSGLRKFNKIKLASEFLKNQ